MRALITGAGGQLARELLATAPAGVEVRPVSRAECDITDRVVVERIVTSFRPDVVINTAAYTAVDAAEDNEELAFRTNADGAENVARCAELVGSSLIHISTDYVFDGRRTTPYPTDAPANPINVYGRSKLEGEKLTLAASATGVVVRSGWLYASRGRNFLMSILAALRAGRPLSVVRDQEGTPTSARHLATVIWKIPGAELRGIYHWVNAGSASWYEFAREIAVVARRLKLLDEVPEIRPVTSAEYQSRAARPACSVLDPAKLVAVLGVTPTPWQQALATEMRVEFTRDRQRGGA